MVTTQEELHGKTNWMGFAAFGIVEHLNHFGLGVIGPPIFSI
jgi:hypothetical protein